VDFLSTSNSGAVLERIYCALRLVSKLDEPSLRLLPVTTYQAGKRAFVGWDGIRTNVIPLSGGMAAKNLLNASSPLAKAPILTTGNGRGWVTLSELAAL
jgi:hypothetical protein